MQVAFSWIQVGVESQIFLLPWVLPFTLMHLGQYWLVRPTSSQRAEAQWLWK